VDSNEKGKYTQLPKKGKPEKPQLIPLVWRIHGPRYVLSLTVASDSSLSFPRNVQVTA